MSVGKQASGSGAAPMAAGASLEAMRRRVRLSRLAVWTVIAAGPVALAVTLASTPTTVAAAVAAPTTPSALRTAPAAVEPAGYAQLFVGAWLRSNADDATSAQARLAHSMAPDVDLPDPAPGAQSKLASVTAMRSAQLRAGAWSVTVVAQSTDGAVRYYAVPVTANRSSTEFVVTGTPAVVAGPVRASVEASPYRVTVPEGDLSSAVGEFLGAYLTGSGEVSRYLAPGVAMAAVSPAPYTAVVVEQVVAVEQAAASEQMPDDGTRIRIAARVQAQDAAGRWPLAYELVMRARSDRWEVAALESGAVREGGAR
ncbi:conjugal transfer protein [Streptomyces sp. NPDC005381]|uniref:conjugal transfer protein n=1 Tax=Streptomyces sp. NPDC005381 TaxID=3364714 RepID=UPI0036BDA495